MKLLVTLLFITFAHAEIAKVYDTKNSQYISYNQFLAQLPSTGYISLGEFHNDIAIQNAQSQIINDHVVATNSASNFKVMWEFLNFTDQEKTRIQFDLFEHDTISVDTFISNTAGKQNLTYAPIFETAKRLQGDVVGLNLPRPIKKQAMEGGIDSIDPLLIPVNYRLGSKNYLLRFKEAMGGHAPDDILTKYFLAQSLTDSVMSYHSYINHENLSFIVAGSFHTDFYDGTVGMLKELTEDSVSSLKVVNLNSLSEEEIAEFNSKNAKYGFYADFIIYSK